ncbi:MULTISPECIES: helix-turn-helix transcriptional regulator [Nocardia]|uniref:helix-turn-helix transcriptional regulator n=1 Tax=Nocardia TaxID=1817 RepID=UPI0007A53487|nr:MULTISPECIES: helix-turn-helix transcriptional regulator [Nocardia]
MTEQYHPHAQAIGQLLKERRVALGLKQADMLGVGGPSKPTISAWERGKIPTTPNQGTLRAFDAALQWKEGETRRLLDEGITQPQPAIQDLDLSEVIDALGTIMRDTWSYHEGVKGSADLSPELEQLGRGVVARSADLFRKLIEQQASPPTEDKPEAGTSGSHRAPGVPSRRG